MRHLNELGTVHYEDEVLCTNDYECECAACLDWRTEGVELERAWSEYFQRLESGTRVPTEGGKDGKKQTK